MEDKLFEIEEIFVILFVIAPMGCHPFNFFQEKRFSLITQY